MGVIQRFAVSSMVLGVLAMAGGASALAFENGGGAAPAPAQSTDQASVTDLASDVPSDSPELLPDTGGPDAAVGWFAPRGR